MALYFIYCGYKLKEAVSYTTAPKKRNEITLGVSQPVDEIPVHLFGASNLY